jgi:hypothetical protein
VRSILLLTLISMVMASGPRPQVQTPSPTLKKIAEFDLPGPPGKRFDYLTIDSDDHYLISAHLAAGQPTSLICARIKLWRQLPTHLEPKASSMSLS